MKIHIIAAALPPKLDGIGDYTALLAAELARSATVKVLTAQRDPAPIPGAAVETVFDATDPRSVWSIARAVTADPPDWVLLQYNPFSYGKWGLNLHLPLVMGQIKRRCPGTKVAVMFHEKFVPLDKWQFLVMTLWQRPQFSLLSRTSDVVFFSTEAWAEAFQAKSRRKPVMHLPVASNIPRLPLSRVEARERLSIQESTFVIGIFGAMHISRLLSWVSSAAQALRETGQEMLVLYIGPDKDAVRAALGSLPLMALGPLPASEVSYCFSAMDINLTPFADGVSTRRGSLMTGLQHGIASVGTVGYNTDSVLQKKNGTALLLAPIKAPEQFPAYVLRLSKDPALREQIGRNGQQFYEREFGWKQSAARIMTCFADYVRTK